VPAASAALLAAVLLAGLALVAAAGPARADARAVGAAAGTAAAGTAQASNASASNASAGTAAASTAPAASSAPRQRITVSASSYGTTYATLRAYQLSGSSSTHWVEVFGPWTARVGYNGVAPPGKKREGDGRTPSGTYGFSFFFGVLANPGALFPYRHAYSYDYWDDDPRSARYNEWVDTRSASAGRAPERLHVTPAYNYAAVIAYNVARTPGLGSAIFLHVGTGGATAGCVSLPSAELVKVLRWLKPAAHPTITISG
jgi:L,D-peptidoglycan transpeptidase YkuD (ErfK/YbiS/YcfS/YnhG family)